MKTYLVTSVTLLVLSIPAFSAAAPGRQGPYFSGFLGTSIFKDIDSTSYDYQYTPIREHVELNPGFYAGGTGGYDFGFVRVEGELSFRGADIDTITSKTNSYLIHNVDGTVGAFSSMINVFFDLHNRSRFTPYLGGGIGIAIMYISDTYGYVSKKGSSTYYETLYWESDDTVFAYQLGGGVDIALNNRLSLDVGYRYFRTGEARFNSDYWDYTNSSSSMRFKSHNAMVGLKMKF